MKKETAINRLEKRFTGNKNTVAYKKVLSFLNDENIHKYYRDDKKIIRPVHSSGSGRFTSIQDHNRPIKEILTLLGVKFISGNDAPRGGKTGDFIQVTNIK
jgi:hypothetical protein